MRKVRTTLALLAAYLLATFLPGPGLWLRGLDVGAELVHPPQILLALLLFSAGICTSQDALRRVFAFRMQLVWSLLLVWLVPSVAASLIVFGYSSFNCPPSVALGIVIVSAMPIANSSVAWSALLKGHVALSISLLVCATALSPVLTPFVVEICGREIGSAHEVLADSRWNQGMGLFFLIWVLLPVSAGVAVSSLLTSEQRGRLSPWLRHISLTILILLNYLNGAACLPELARRPLLLAWPVVVAVSLLCLSFLVSRLFARFSESRSFLPHFNSANRNSLSLAVMMRNTGAALVFAGGALPDFPLVSITIVTYTLVQHLGVGLLIMPGGVKPDSPLANRDLSSETDEPITTREISTSFTPSEQANELVRN